MSGVDNIHLEALRESSTATVSTILRKRGIRRVSMDGPQPLRSGQPRIVAPAATLRFVPAREDISTPESATGPRSARAAVQRFPAGSIVVVDAHGFTRAGVFGDIVCAYMQKNLNLVGLVTDGSVRDVASLLISGWPIWASGSAPPPSPEGFFLADAQVAVACGGATVFPGDVIVADDDGVVVIPQDLVAAVATEAFEMERFESWVHLQVQAGAPLAGLYPPDEATLERYRLEVAGQ